jgi:N-acetylglucosamine-6-phosphate deacetylase
MIPRLKNYIWEQLAADELWAGLISDGFHLPSAVLKVFFRTKGPGRIILVSDCSLCGGLKPGLYKSGAIDVEVFSDGHLGLPGTTLLAGAGHLLDWDIPVFMKAAGLELGETIRLCTQNPAALLGLEKEYGRLETGSPANLCFFSLPGEGALAIKKVFREGKEIFSAGEKSESTV